MRFVHRVTELVLVMLAASSCSSSDSAAAAPLGAAGTGGSGGSAGAAGAEAGGDAPSDAVQDAGFPSPVADGCIDDPSAGTHVYDCDGIKYDATIPDACVGSACGLIFDVHGFSMSGEMEDANTNLADLGRQHGYVVFQPNANPSPPLSSWTPSTDDDKVFAVLQSAISVWHIDEKRVHFTGFSQGGNMTWRFICDHADVLASAAPAAGTGCTFKAPDMPSRELDVLYLHGTKDALVNFDNLAVPQRDSLVAGWAMGAPTVVASDATYEHSRWTNANGTVFEMFKHDYKAGPCAVTIDGHCFPGSGDLDGGLTGQACGFACRPPNAFTWGEEIIKFFMAHPKKG